ncbi:hypothetical protein QA789_15875 [Streptomyces sp. B21-088]
MLRIRTLPRPVLAVGIAVALPSVFGTSDILGALPWVAGAHAVTRALASIMILPRVRILLPTWLRIAPPKGRSACLGPQREGSA